MPDALALALTPGTTAFQPLAFYTVVALTLYVLLGAFIWLKPLPVAKRPFLTWAVMIPAAFLPMWLGVHAWIAFVAALSIYGFKEFAKGTGLYAQKSYCLLVDVMIILLAISAMMRDYGMFMALPVWGAAAITALPVLQNRTENALQYMALSIIGLVYFGWFLGHLGFLAQSSYGWGYCLFVLIFTQLNDALCFLWGKLFGKTTWTRLSPKKTVEGSILGLCTTILIAFLNWPTAFPQFGWPMVLLAGLLVGVGGQTGDLVMSAIKRDLGIKDFGSLLPGHGGILDRVDSLLWVSPLFFHMARYFYGGFGY